MTLLYHLDPNNIDQSIINTAAALLQQGETVAFPTETVYGLGANALDPEAVKSIFTAKGRPSDNPLIVHIADTGALRGIISVMPAKAELLIERFWPGPLTLIFPKAEGVPDAVTAGLDTVGVRMPDNPVALALIKAAGVPVAAPSANSSGRPSPTRAAHVVEDLWGKVAAILDAGSCRVGVESTVLDLTVDPPMILRPGGITREQLQEALGEDVRVDPGIAPSPRAKASPAPRAPGMKYTHYAPKAPMTLFVGHRDQVVAAMAEQASQATGQGLKVGILLTTPVAFMPGDLVITLGDEAAQSPKPKAQSGGANDQHDCSDDSCWLRANPHRQWLTSNPVQDPDHYSDPSLEAIANGIFDALRRFDEAGVDIILGQGVPPVGLGQAIMNRLTKAAGGDVVAI